MAILKKGLILKTIHIKDKNEVELDPEPFGTWQSILPKVEKILEKKATSAKKNCTCIKRIIWKKGMNNLEFDFDQNEFLNHISVQGTIDEEGEKMIQAICFDLNSNYYDNKTGKFY